MAKKPELVGRGPEVTADMKARIEAGWDIWQLWERLEKAESGFGFHYDMAPREEFQEQS